MHFAVSVFLLRSYAQEKRLYLFELIFGIFLGSINRKKGKNLKEEKVKNTKKQKEQEEHEEKEEKQEKGEKNEENNIIKEGIKKKINIKETVNEVSKIKRKKYHNFQNKSKNQLKRRRSGSYREDDVETKSERGESGSIEEDESERRDSGSNGEDDVEAQSERRKSGSIEEDESERRDSGFNGEDDVETQSKRRKSWSIEEDELERRDSGSNEEEDLLSFLNSVIENNKRKEHIYRRFGSLLKLFIYF
jgi:hypothetical protein